VPVRPQYIKEEVTNVAVRHMQDMDTC